ncbi:MAG: hypothetical protein ACOC1K_02030 [Nanoarchaeota archaeon]
MDCKHKRKKKIYSHGRKSKPILVCKDCDEIINRNGIKRKKNKVSSIFSVTYCRIHKTY